jgi:hypothetical protein
VSATCLAQSHFIGDGFVVLTRNGEPNVYFDTDLPTANPDFTGIVASIYPTDVLQIGGEVETFATAIAFGGDIVTLQADVVTMLYSVNGGPSQSLELLFRLHPDGAPAIDRWDEVGQSLMPSLMPLLSVGLNTLSVTFASQDFNHPVAPGLTQSLGPFTAQIEVIPEPGTVVMGLLAAAGAGVVTLRRRWG